MVETKRVLPTLANLLLYRERGEGEGGDDELGRVKWGSFDNDDDDEGDGVVMTMTMIVMMMVMMIKATMVMRIMAMTMT